MIRWRQEPRVIRMTAVNIKISLRGCDVKYWNNYQRLKAVVRNTSTGIDKFAYQFHHVSNKITRLKISTCRLTLPTTECKDFIFTFVYATKSFRSSYFPRSLLNIKRVEWRTGAEAQSNA